MFSISKLEIERDGKAEKIDAGEELERRKRIEALKAQVRALGGTVNEVAAPGLPLAMEEAFLRNILAYEKGPFTTHFAQLTRSGFEFPRSRKLDDRQLSAKLAELIRRLAEMGIYLSHTDHLSDRQLYDWLRYDGLRGEIPDLPHDPHEAWHLDLLGGYSEKDISLYQQFYACKEERENHQMECPDQPVPPRTKPPFDRDSKLPKSPFQTA